MKKGEKISVEADSANISSKLRMDYKALLENTGISVVIIDANGKYIFANSTAISPLECDVHDVIGKSMSDFLPPEIAQSYLIRNRQMIKSGEGKVYEATFELPDGPKTFLINDQVLKDEQGNGFAIQSSSIDITEQKETERILAEKEAEYRLLIQNLPGTTVFLFDHDLRFILAEGHINPEFGFTTESIIGKTLWEVLPTENANRISPIYYRTLEGLPTENYISEYQEKSYRVNFVPIRNSQNKIIAGLVVSQDITDIKKIETNLQESEERYRLLFENATDGFMLTDPSNGSVYSANDAACAMFGRTREEIFSTGRGSMIDFTDPRLPGAMEERQRTGKFSGELTGVRKDGTKFPIALTSAMFKDKNGHLRSSMIIQDITARKKAEHLLIESENRYRSLFSEMTEGFALHEIVYDSNQEPIDYRILNVNPSFEKLIGIEAENAVGLLSTKLYGVEEAPYLDIYSRIAKTGEYQSFQIYFSPLDRYFQISAFSPKSGFFATIFTDITEQNLSRMALEESERRFRDMMEHVNMVSIMLDTKGGITFANDYLLKLTGWCEDEVIGQNWFDLFIPDKEVIWPVFFKGIDEEIVPVHHENDILTKSGERRLIRWSNTILKNSKGKVEGLAAIGVDITDARNAEKALQESEASLRELNATKDKFFSIIAHDLKGPFNSILGLSSIIEEQVQDKSYDEVGKYASLIRSSSELTFDLLKNLLEWSRSQTGKMDFSPEYLDLVALIDDAFQLMENSARQKSVAVVRRLPKNLLAFVDRSMMGTILRNLISNAIKFTMSGGEIIILAQQTNTEIRVTIADNGIGIRKENLDKIFRIDENHSTLGTIKEKGTGLGLILCKEFIEKHGGRIWADSEFGKGSRFHFAIPKV